jgi:hypothetical protein
MYVVDTLEGTGLLHKDSITKIGEGDLWFVSRSGVQSLARAIAEKNNPLVSLTRNVRSLIRSLEKVHVGASTEAKMVFSPENEFVLLLYPASNTVVLLSTKFRLEDGTYRVAQWTFGEAEVDTMLVRDNGDILFGINDGSVARYEDNRDDSTVTAATYDLVYSSPWLDFGAHNNIKIVKDFYAVLYGRETLTAVARWAFDYRPLEFTETFTSDYTASGSEFGIGEFGEDEFTDGARLRRNYIGGGGEGLVVQLKVTITSTDVDDVMAIQELGAHAKLGAMR